MLTPGIVGTFMIFAIPIVAIVAYMYRSYLKHNSEGPANKQIVSDLIDTVEELANRLEATRAERDAIRQRLQNLETIVTSETWDDRVPSSSASLDATASANASTKDTERAEEADASAGTSTPRSRENGTDKNASSSDEASAGGPGAGSTGDTSRTPTPLLDRPEHDPDAASSNGNASGQASSSESSTTDSSSADRAADIARRLKDR